MFDNPRATALHLAVSAGLGTAKATVEGAELFHAFLIGADAAPAEETKPKTTTKAKSETKVEPKEDTKPAAGFADDGSEISLADIKAASRDFAEGAGEDDDEFNKRLEAVLGWGGVAADGKIGDIDPSKYAAVLEGIKGYGATKRRSVMDD